LKPEIKNHNGHEDIYSLTSSLVWPSSNLTILSFTAILILTIFPSSYEVTGIKSQSFSFNWHLDVMYIKTVFSDSDLLVSFTTESLQYNTCACTHAHTQIHTHKLIFLFPIILYLSFSPH